MADIAKVRSLLVVMKNIAVHLTDDEISKIGLILQNALERLES